MLFPYYGIDSYFIQHFTEYFYVTTPSTIPIWEKENRFFFFFLRFFCSFLEKSSVHLLGGGGGLLIELNKPRSIETRQ